MFVCICNAVKDTEISKAIAEGHNTIDALKQELDVATCCGGCQPVVESMIEEYANKFIQLNPKLFKEVA